MAGLSPRIERALEGSPRRRVGELLALDAAELRVALPAADEAGSVSAPQVGAIRDELSRTGVWACCKHDSRYPTALRDLDGQSPACLFGRGDVGHLERLEGGGAVTVVGSRRPSAHGKDVAVLLGRQLAAAGFAVVSGMAIGIDACAHEGALAAEGLTVAVLGAGPDAPSPPRMRRLYEEIVGSGVVVSELPPGTGARRWTFPARNRIMAALGEMSVVVEARVHSGSLITADLAQELGREVGAVPGQVGTSFAAGTNQLLRDGAQVIRSAQDVLDSLLGPGAPAGALGAMPVLEPELGVVLELVESGASTLDAVAREGGLPASVAGAALTRLELIGRIRCDSAGRYRPRAAD